MTRLKTSFRCTLVSTIAITTLAGCAHSLVYNEGRDKQGQGVKRATTELKMVDTVHALEKSYAEVAKLELESAKSLAETLRNKELQRVARAKALREHEGLYPKNKQPLRFSGLLNVLETRMETLGAKSRPDAAANADANSARNCGSLDCGKLRTIQGTPAVLEEQRLSFELSRVEFRALYGYDFRTCADVEAAQAKEKNALPLKNEFARKFAAAPQRSGLTVNGSYEELTEKCKRIAEQEKEFRDALDPKKGEIRTVLNQTEQAEKDIAAHRAMLVEVEELLASEVQKFRDEEEKLVVNKESRLSNLQKRADKLKTVIAGVRKGADAVGDAGSHAVAKARVSHLETVLGAITGQQSATDKLDAHDRAAVAFVRSLPELADEADKLLKEAGRARLVPFVIAREHYRLAVKGFEDDLAIKTRRAEALRARADAMTHELSALASVHFLLTDDKRAWEPQSLAQLNSSTDAKNRQSLYRALAIYWDEVFLYRSEEQIWNAKANALLYDEGLVRGTTAALQWDNLIGGIGNVLADYHAAGVKPAEISEFLKALGLVYIGTRIGQ